VSPRPLVRLKTVVRQTLKGLGAPVVPPIADQELHFVEVSKRDVVGFLLLESIRQPVPHVDSQLGFGGLEGGDSGHGFLLGQSTGNQTPARVERTFRFALGSESRSVASDAVDPPILNATREEQVVAGSRRMLVPDARWFQTHARAA